MLSITHLYKALKYRKEIIEQLNTLPSVAKRNLKTFISVPRSVYNYNNNNTDFNVFEYMMNYIAYLDNKPVKIRQKLLNKIFRSNYDIDDIVNFLEEKINLLQGEKMTKTKVKKIVTEYNNILDIIYNENNIVVVEVLESYGIKAIGYNSLWCFTYGDNNWQDWNTYSHNGMVYVIFDFNLSQEDDWFMCVVIKPVVDVEFDYDELEESYSSPIYSMLNEPITNYPDYLQSTFKNDDWKNVLTFEIN